MEIPVQVDKIISTLMEHGFEAYAVGGCVRDMLLGRTPDDWDITTSARPEQVKQLFRRTIDTGIEHGTVTIMDGEEGFEVTTYRIDGEYVDGRHPKSVEFTPNLVEDLKRRDFTINAMAYSHETGIVDAFGGQEDLQAGVIRCVGCAMDRFSEDALRILRAIRFSAQLGFQIEEETAAAIEVIAPNIAKVSKERIQVELTKLLLSAHPMRILQVFESGISSYISETFATIPYQKIQISAGLPKLRFLRYGAMLRVVSPETAVRIMRDLKMDNDTTLGVRTIVTWINTEMMPDEVMVRRAMSRMSPEIWDALLELMREDERTAREECTTELDTENAGSRVQQMEQLTKLIRERGDCLSLKTMNLKGQDLIAAGVKSGKAMGDLLSNMLEYVLVHPEKNTKEELLTFLQTLPKDQA